MEDFGIDINVTDYGQCLLECESLDKAGSTAYIRDLNASITDLLIHIKTTGELEAFWGTVEKQNFVAIKQAAKVEKEQRRLQLGDFFDSERDESKASDSSEQSDWSCTSSESEQSSALMSKAVSVNDLGATQVPTL